MTGLIKQENDADLVDLTIDDEDVAMPPLNDEKGAETSSNGEQPTTSQERNEKTQPITADTKDARQCNTEVAVKDATKETFSTISNKPAPCTKMPNQDLTTGSSSQDGDLVQGLSVSDLGGQNPDRPQNDGDKRFSIACVFRQSLGGKSAIGICREAALHYVRCIP